MVRRKPYTENEVILCTYIARFGRGLVSEELIRSLFDLRSLDSVEMKVRNIARMLSEEGYRHSQEVFPWGGGHRSHWQVVQPYADLADADFTARIKELLARVKEILDRARGRHQSRPPRDMTPKLINNALGNQLTRTSAQVRLPGTESVRRNGLLTAPRRRRMGDEDYLQLGETHEP